MVNMQRGEVALVVGDRTYRLKMTMNAAAVAEHRTGRSMFTIMRAAESLSFKDIRTALWVLLQKFHAEQFKTEEDAGNLLDEAGGIDAFFALFEEIGKANQPEGAQGGDNANPPAAQAGIGDGSTSSSGATA